MWTCHLWGHLHGCVSEHLTLASLCSKLQVGFVSGECMGGGSPRVQQNNIVSEHGEVGNNNLGAAGIPCTQVDFYT